MTRLLLLTASAILLAGCQPPADPAAEVIPQEEPFGPVSFTSHVRPVLSDKCFQCHGPDAGTREADLRLDTPDGAYAALSESAGHAIVAGDPAASVAWQRIDSTDPDERMPPPDSNLALSEREKQTLRHWIKQGAEYEAHWAFTPPPATIPLPDISDPG